jgi:hypothetical protein
MKKIQTIPLSALLLIWFCFAQCHKDKNPPHDNPYGLPNATQTGAGVFACLINGQKFIAGREPSYSNGAQLRGDTLAVAGEPKNGKYFEIISLTIQGNLHQDKIYNIDSINAIVAIATDSTCRGITSNVVTSYSKSGTIHLTRFDTVNKIVSGIFTNCIFHIPNCDTLRVTNGRFDYHYYN